MPITTSTRDVSLASGSVQYDVLGSGRPIVYLPSAGGARRTPVLDRLAESYAVYVPATDGFDGTPSHESIDSVRALTNVTAEFVAQVVGGSCDVIGHSLGAQQALWLGIEHPNLVDHLVVIAPDGLRSGDNHDLVARLGELDALTLILAGTDDSVCPPESVRLLRREIRNAFLVYVWDAAHAPEVEQPDRTFSLIESFLTRSEAFMVNWGTLAVSR